MARRGGWRRTGRKRFRYVDSHGREIVDGEQLERIRSLAIPPAWRDVWISPSPRARLQATGFDAAGRKQYLYHPSYRAAQERAKFERLLDFARALPGLRSRAERHLRLGPYEEEWTCALAVGVVNKAWFRVGSDRHASRSRTYGVTTLRKRHVTVSGDEISFCFRTKNRALVRRRLRSPRLARGVDDLLALPDGSRLFRFERDGELVDLTAPLLNAYLAEHSGAASRPRTSAPGAGRCSPRRSSRRCHRRRARRKRSACSRVSCERSGTSSVTRRPSHARRTSARRSSTCIARGGRSRGTVERRGSGPPQRGRASARASPPVAVGHVRTFSRTA